MSDARPIRLMLEAGMQGFVASSFSKNLSLYSERCGALSVVCKTKEQAKQVLTQLCYGVRQHYSSPPLHGAQIVNTILSDDALRAIWLDELAISCAITGYV